MDVGMLWFDNDPKLGVFNKVEKAAAYYREKYGKDPNLCYVHPSMLADQKEKPGTVMVYGSTTMIPHHFWIGVESSAFNLVSLQAE